MLARRFLTLVLAATAVALLATLCRDGGVEVPAGCQAGMRTESRAQAAQAAVLVRERVESTPRQDHATDPAGNSSSLTHGSSALPNGLLRIGDEVLAVERSYVRDVNAALLWPQFSWLQIGSEEPISIELPAVRRELGSAR